MSTNIIPFHQDWSGKLEWAKRHEESRRFAMKIAVHSEKQECNFHDCPRTWNTYLLGGDQGRYYRDGKPEYWIDRCPLTDLVWEHRESLFNDLPWNGGQTFFEIREEKFGPHAGLRHWCVGDDYAHLWDSEQNRWDQYNFHYVSGQIEIISGRFWELIQAKGITKRVDS